MLHFHQLEPVLLQEDQGGGGVEEQGREGMPHPRSGESSRTLVHHHLRRAGGEGDLLPHPRGPTEQGRRGRGQHPRGPHHPHPQEVQHQDHLSRHREARGELWRGVQGQNPVTRNQSIKA